MEVSHPGSTLRVETMPASPASPTKMATAGYFRNGATAIFDGVWTINSEIVQLDEERAMRRSAEGMWRFGGHFPNGGGNWP